MNATIYCDASTKGEYSGIGICLLDSTGSLIREISRRVSGYRRNNTALEAHAVCVGVALAAKLGYTNIRVYTDSRAVVRVARKGSARTQTMKKFALAMASLRKTISVTLRWVRGHAGQKWNTLADKLSRSAKWTFNDAAWAFVSKYIPMTRQATLFNLTR